MCKLSIKSACVVVYVHQVEASIADVQPDATDQVSARNVFMCEEITKYVSVVAQPVDTGKTFSRVQGMSPKRQGKESQAREDTPLVD